MTINRKILSSIIFISSMLSGFSAIAEENTNAKDADISIRIGAAFLNGSANVGSTPDATNQSLVNFDDLGVTGLDYSLYINTEWQFTSNWKLGLEYFGVSQTSTQVIDTQIEFGELVIPVNGEVTANFGVDVYALTAAYSLLSDQDKEISVGFGVHISDLEAGIAGAGFVAGVPVSQGKSSASATAPLPNLRLAGNFSLTDDWSLDLRAGYFSLAYDKYDGQFVTASALIEWQPQEGLGFGVGYSYFDIELTVNASRTTDVYNVSVSGPTIYAVMQF